MEKSIKEFVVSSISNVKAMIDSTNIIGNPLKISEKEVIVPISRLSFGFGVGGSELLNNRSDNNLLFEYSSDFPLAGGGVGGASLHPEAFLYINDGKVEIIKMKEDKTIYDRIYDFYKDIVKTLNKETKKGSHKRT